MTSSGSASIHFTSSTEGSGQSHKHRTRLRNIYKQARQEFKHFSRLGPTSSVTEEGYKNTLASISSLKSQKRLTRELGKERRALLQRLAELEGSTVRSTKRSYFEVRKDEGFLRPEISTRNSELFDHWTKSTDDSRRHAWTTEDWAYQNGKITEECNKSKRTNAILRDDIRTLRSIISQCHPYASTIDIESTSNPASLTPDTSFPGTHDGQTSSRELLARMRAKGAQRRERRASQNISL
ncbi:hypothetical protein V865_004506 [Kwoniella europaea PYCC6329]|uniref:Uncharacterized protein n=1 Tax=Kwoniella europaea PYCC6329 TaxID=1423913 RepID=A0AAX4KIS5_9TREE